MRIVALEEHFVVPELLDAWKHLPDDVGMGAGNERIQRLLLDTADGRIAAMDDQGVDVQVLSLNSPGLQNLGTADAAAVARDANDALAGVVAAHPDRFQGFAALPTPDPAAAAAELERAVTSLGFPGALTNGRTGTTNMDAPEYDDLYAVAARLGAPLYLHPQTPVAPVRQAYYSGLGGGLDAAFATAGLGWHYETGVQFLRLVFAGVFDRHPDLQVVLGHWGEVVLFFVERIEPMMQGWGLALDRPLHEVLRENLWVTGSGILSQRYLRWASEVVGLDRLMAATDYPWVDNGDGKARAFLEDAGLTDEQRDGIASGNWERLTGGVRPDGQSGLKR